MKIFCQKCGNELKDNVLICPKCGYENVVPKNRTKILPLIIGLVATIIIVGVSLFYLRNTTKIPYLSRNNVDNDAVANCSFEITDVKKSVHGGPDTNHQEALDTFKKYKSVHNIYTPTQDAQEGWDLERTNWELDNYRWVLYEGVIKNTSSNRQFLKQMHVKLYTSTDIFLAEGYGNGDIKLESKGLPKGIWVESNTAVPFLVGVKYENEDYIKAYIDEGDPLKETIYPWFETCTY